MIKIYGTSILGNPFYMQNEYQTYGLMKNERYYLEKKEVFERNHIELAISLLNG